ncbi:MAG TPA: GH3 auxin-responsive promoter family protein [Dehalococcoidia bacterium]|nr:GH3 auxin-responsive promoter family protein [Dehalococcoidia bacterium]
MLPEDKYFQTLTQDELWQRYCGFLDLSIDEFMQIQKELLMDEIEQVADSWLGKKIMNNLKPKSVEEFRRMVPLTTYNDYEPYLSERQENALAGKPYLWCHSAGRRGRFKWIPHSNEIVEKTVRSYLACCILASCSKKGEINIAPGFRLLTVLPPPPYTSGSIVLSFFQHFSTRIIPPLDGMETVEFRERMKKGFQIALQDGVDIIGTLASILVRMGEEFSQQTRGIKFSLSMLHTKIIFRLLRAWLYSKWEKRAMLPKDLWRPKGILMGGLDTSIYKDDVAHYWGSIPYELYAGTEALIYAMQSWNKTGMVFLHDMVFLEFIPYEELLKLQDDKHYQPSTVLLNEVEEGKLYEVVITHFYGMPLLRYRLNDIIRVIATKDEETGINLPQIVFQRRGDEVINLAALAHLDEKTLWQAIANSGIKYTDWAACKEYDRNQSFLRLYFELKEEKEAAEVETVIDEQLKTVDMDYKDIASYLGLQPVRVTLLSPGTFQRYTEEKQKEGANLDHLRPPHINPQEAVVRHLLQLSAIGNKK